MFHLITFLCVQGCPKETNFDSCCVRISYWKQCLRWKDNETNKIGRSLVAVLIPITKSQPKWVKREKEDFSAKTTLEQVFSFL